MGAKATGWAVDYRDAFQSPWTKPLWIKRGVHSFGLHNPLEYVKNEMLLYQKLKILQAFFSLTWEILWKPLQRLQYIQQKYRGKLKDVEEWTRVALCLHETC